MSDHDRAAMQALEAALELGLAPPQAAGNPVHDRTPVNRTMKKAILALEQFLARNMNRVSRAARPTELRVQARMPEDN